MRVYLLTCSSQHTEYPEVNFIDNKWYVEDGSSQDEGECVQVNPIRRIDNRCKHKIDGG